jgi:hypothetical protein
MRPKSSPALFGPADVRAMRRYSEFWAAHCRGLGHVARLMFIQSGSAETRRDDRLPLGAPVRRRVSSVPDSLAAVACPICGRP